MLNMKNNPARRTCSRLNSRGKKVAKNTRSTASFVQNLELQRALTLACPRGFLFHLNKDSRGVKTRALNEVSMMLQGKRISAQLEDLEKERVASDTNSSLNVSSIIKQSILERRTLSLLTASKLKDLSIKGKTKFYLKTTEKPGKDSMNVPQVNFKPPKKNLNVLPRLEKHKTYDEDRRLYLDCNKVLLEKPRALNKNRKNWQVTKERYEAANKENSNSNPAVGSLKKWIISEEISSRKKRTVTIFLPLVQVDDQCCR